VQHAEKTLRVWVLIIIVSWESILLHIIMCPAPAKPQGLMMVYSWLGQRGHGVVSSTVTTVIDIQITCIPRSAKSGSGMIKYCHTGDFYTFE